MLEIVYYVATSLDGYIATSDGGVDWLEEFGGAGEDYGYTDFFASVDALIMGSSTYEQARGFGEWPYADKPCRVMSRRSLASDRSTIVITDEDPERIAADLEVQGARRAWMVGGAKAAAAFQHRELLTEYQIAVIPILLGAGVPLFDPGGRRESLELLDQQSYSDGVVTLRYGRR